MSDIVLPNVIERIKGAIEKEIKINQPVSNWASRLGHPCARHLVHSRLDWDKLPRISPEKKMLFDVGNVFERHVAKVYLEKAGFDIIEMDRPIQSEASGLLKRVKVHGKIDFVCRDGKAGIEFPVEAKSMNPNTWEKIDTIEDMFESRHYWVKQYPGQLMIYLLGKNYEIGLFLIINKVTGEPKAIWVHQDYTYAEDLIKKAELVNKHVEASTYPDRIAYDDNICGKCDFANICLPDLVRNEADIITDPDLEADLDEREKCKPFKARYDDLDRGIKKRLKDIPKALVGDFMILGKAVHRDGYAVEPTDYWQVSVKKLGGEK